MYKLSTNVLVLENHLLNYKTGELYVIDNEGRNVLDDLSKDIITENEITSFMKQEGILVDPSFQKDKESFHLQWHLLNKCNLKCKHCYDWKNRIKTLDFKQNLVVVDNYVEFLKKMELNGEISLTGGEPTMYDKLEDLIHYIKSRDVFIRVAVLSNGIYISDKLIDFFKANDVSVQISIDGVEDKHDEIRGKGSYKNAVKTIQKLNDNEIRYATHCVLMKRNTLCIKEYIYEMAKIGVKKITFSQLVPIAFGKNEEYLSPLELKFLYEKIVKIQKKVNVDVIGTRPLWVLVGSSGVCPVGHKTLTISADGKFMPCRRMPIEIGNVVTDTFFKVWFGSDLLIKMRNREKNLKKCGQCKYLESCAGCRALAQAITGNPFEKDPSCWLTEEERR